MMPTIRKTAASLTRAVLGFVLLTIVASGGAARASDSVVRFPGGTIAAADVTSHKPVRALSVVGPAYALWGREGFAAPVRFDLYANHLAFIDRWQLSIHRSGDETFSRPLKTFSGLGASLLDGLTWDGKPDTGPPIRPGETLSYTLRVADAARNIDATEPRDFLVARYLPDTQRSTLAREVAAMRAGARSGAPLRRAEIPVGGATVMLTLSETKAAGQAWFDGALVTADGTGRATLEQILPPGAYTLPVRMGPVERVLDLRVDGEAALRAPLLSVPPLSPGAGPSMPGLEALGLASGADVLAVAAPALRPEARAALTRIDPDRVYGVYSDSFGGTHVRVGLEAYAALWGGAGGEAAPVPEPLSIAAHGLRVQPPEAGASPAFMPASAPAGAEEKADAGWMSRLTNLLSRRLVLDW